MFTELHTLVLASIKERGGFVMTDVRASGVKTGGGGTWNWSSNHHITRMLRQIKNLNTQFFPDSKRNIIKVVFQI